MIPTERRRPLRPWLHSLWLRPQPHRRWLRRPRPRLHHARPRLAVSYWPIHGNGPYHPPPATPSPEAEVIEARQPLSSRSGRTGTWSPAVLGLADNTSDGASNGVAPGTRLPAAAPTRKSVEAWRVLLPALMQPSDHGSFRL
ncbi:hypothetical protein D1007_04044 [Hordeum vulgare]|nr:hypothetical protein D1007_04044 [Hordeum vulgare]